SGNAPSEMLGTGTLDGKVTCQKAWQTWWGQNQGRLNLQDREEDWRRPGLMMLSERVDEDRCHWLVGCDSTTRGQWKGLRGGAEVNTVIWKRAVPEPVAIAKLSNATSLKVTAGGVLTLNSAGRVVSEVISERNPHEVRPCFGLV